MCRNIKRLRRPNEEPSDQELHDAALQFVRKISGFNAPSKANETAFNNAVRDVAEAGRVLFRSLRIRGERQVRMPTSPLHSVTHCLLIAALSAACAAGTKPSIPPAPIRAFWPDPAFDPSRQCHGNLPVATLESLLPQARLALQVPGTEEVVLDSSRRCLRITVEDIETGRFTALLLRGVAVPRQAVLLQLAHPEGQS